MKFSGFKSSLAIGCRAAELPGYCLSHERLGFHSGYFMLSVYAGQNEGFHQ